MGTRKARVVGQKEAHEVVRAGGSVVVNGRREYVGHYGQIHRARGGSSPLPQMGVEADHYQVVKEPPFPTDKRAVAGVEAVHVLRNGGEVSQPESGRTYFVNAAGELRVRRRKDDAIGNPTDKTLDQVNRFVNGYVVTKEPKAEAPKRYVAGQAAIDHLLAGGTLWGLGRDRTDHNVWQSNNGRLMCGESVASELWFNDGMAREVRTEPPAPKAEAPAAYVDLLTSVERGLMDRGRATREALLAIIDRLAPPPPAKKRRSCTLGEAVDAMLADKVVIRNGTGYFTSRNATKLVDRHEPTDTYEVED
jgi:hypothetical protein